MTASPEGSEEQRFVDECIHRTLDAISDQIALIFQLKRGGVDPSTAERRLEVLREELAAWRAAREALS